MYCVNRSGASRRVAARLSMSCVLLVVGAGCAVDVTEYTPFAKSSTQVATASTTDTAPVHTASIGKAGSGAQAVQRAAKSSRNPDAAARTVVVRQGDTVYGIARTNRVGVNSLIAANRLVAPYRIRPGQSLRLPGGAMQLAGAAADPVVRPATARPVTSQFSDSAAGTGGRKTVVVRSGDTVYSLARRNGLSVGAFSELNGLKSPYTIRPGDVLTVAYADPVMTGGISGGGSGSAERADTAPKKPATIGGLPAKDVRKYNRIANKYQIVPGQTVLVPF